MYSCVHTYIHASKESKKESERETERERDLGSKTDQGAGSGEAPKSSLRVQGLGFRGLGFRV